MGDDARWHTRRSLGADLAALGLRADDQVMVHAGLRSVGPMLGGADDVVAALLDAVGEGGTLIAYTDWEIAYHHLLDDEGRVPPAWRDDLPPFDPARSRSARDNGALPELVRTTPGALRSGGAGASVAAIGARAAWFTDDHPLDYGYGPGSPLARLVEARGRVLMLGAPLDTMTLLHHAEHLADVPGKKVIRFEVPLAGEQGTSWHTVEEFDTSDPVVEGLDDDYFATVVEELLASGHGVRGTVGDAPSVLVEAAETVAFAVDWLERRVG